MAELNVVGCALCAVVALACGEPAPDVPSERSPESSNTGSGGSRAIPNTMAPVAASGSSGELLAPAASQQGVPCEIAAIVSERCTTCHGATPQFNAPMALVTGADFQATVPSTATQSVRDVASARINAADSSRRMPPPGTVEALEPSELSALTAWLDAGAPSAAGGCSILDQSAVEGQVPIQPLPSVTGSTLEPYEGWDVDVECYPFVASSGNGTSPYAVGRATDSYIGFGFMPPWEGTRYVRAFRQVIDNAQVLHHWLLFEQAGAVQDGSVTPQVGAHPDGQLMHGWAPGGGDVYYTPDVGLRMDSTKGYLLEVHYNSTDANATDASGVEVCVTQTPPANEASLSWLGTDAINGTTASGTCAPRITEPVRIIAGNPHMHLKGRHMTVTVERANGSSEVVHDEAFSFENQRIYNEDIQLLPGDSIRTECTFSGPATFGKGTNQEMCYWFAMAYPAGRLADGGLIGTLVHGANACLGR
jgi:hypothetical protein